MDVQDLYSRVGNDTKVRIGLNGPGLQNGYREAVLIGSGRSLPGAIFGG